MRHVKRLLVFAMIIMILLTGCGQKNAEDIVDDLTDKLNSLNSYKAVGTMKIQTGDIPQEYSVEVWYKKSNHYRIALNNVNSNITQIVLRNDDGVFVLDPALKKSYRFKSDWPESNGAVYLFHSLAASIIDDNGRTFNTEDEFYVFDVKANYQNQTLTKQKVWLDKNLNPVKVYVFDPQETQLVEMTFTDFKFDTKFDDDAFDVERNLTGWELSSLPAMSAIDLPKDFGVIEPSYLPEGVTKNTPKFVDNDGDRTVVIKYTGEFNYNLIESRPKKDIMASAPDMSDIVDLGFSIGILSEMSEMRTLTWTYDGIEFKLTGDLPSVEMINVAKSVFGQSGK